MVGWRKKLKQRLPAILLLAATLLFWGWYDPYEPVAPPLLSEPVLADALRVRGDVVETNHTFTLRVPTGGKTADLRFKLEDATQYSIIRLSGSIRTEQVVAGKYSWTSARLILIQRDSNAKWVPSKHSLLSADGSVPWTDQTQEFELEPNAASVEVVIQQTGKSGTAHFRNIVAQPVQYRASWTWFRILFAVGWVVVAVLYYRRCRLDRRKLRILILLNALAILYGTLMPGDWIEHVAEGVKQRVAESIRKPPPESMSDSSTAPRKDTPKKVRDAAAETKRINQFNDAVGSVHQAGHLLLFASLCFLVYCSAWLEKQHPVYFIKVGADVLLFSAISESLQYLTVDRTPGISDWMTDVYGLLLAFIMFLLLWILVRFFQILHRRKRV